MVDKSGGAESHRDPTPSRENRGAAGVTDGAGQAGRVQRPLLACELTIMIILIIGFIYCEFTN